MENKIKKTALITGSLLTGAVLSVSPINAATGSIDLGTGSEIRANFLNKKVDSSTLELTCGEKKAAVKKVEDATKTAEHKCGEGKCGEKAKTAEHKCGEGKCGEKKAEVKTAEGATKTAEHKCGEGKCGEGKCGEKKETKTEVKPKK